MVKIKGWKWIEGRGMQDIVYKSIKGRLLFYGHYSTNHKMPYTSRIGYVEIDKKIIRTANRKKAKEYAMKFMRANPNG